MRSRTKKGKGGAKREGAVADGDHAVLSDADNDMLQLATSKSLRQGRRLITLAALLFDCFLFTLVYTLMTDDHHTFQPESNAAVAGFCTVSLVNMALVTYLGLRCWPPTPPLTLTADADTSVYLGRRHISVASSLAVIQFSFQAFDLVATVALPALQKPEMIVHHAVVAFCAWMVFDSDIMHEPALFFLGTCEMQSLPLTLIDYWTAIPPTEGSYQATAFELTKYIFGVLFFYSRIYLWVTKGLQGPCH